MRIDERGQGEHFAAMRFRQDFDRRTLGDVERRLADHLRERRERLERPASRDARGDAEQIDALSRRDEAFQREYAASAASDEAWVAFRAAWLDVSEAEYRERVGARAATGGTR